MIAENVRRAETPTAQHRFGGVKCDREAIDDREETRDVSDIRKALVASAAIFAWLEIVL